VIHRGRSHEIVESRSHRRCSLWWRKSLLEALGEDTILPNSIYNASIRYESEQKNCAMRRNFSSVPFRPRSPRGAGTNSLSNSGRRSATSTAIALRQLAHKCDLQVFYRARSSLSPNKGDLIIHDSPSLVATQYDETKRPRRQ